MTGRFGSEMIDASLLMTPVRTFHEVALRFTFLFLIQNSPFRNPELGMTNLKRSNGNRRRMGRSGGRKAGVAVFWP